jgi:broad specificity phosphatase PhoE
MDLVLIRHPETAVDAGICYGRSDVPLAGDARVASDALFQRLNGLGAPPPQTLWTSPLRRCASVAAWLARDCGCVARADPRLQEIDFGAWERMRWETIDRTALDAWAADFIHARVHGGESVAQFAARVAAWFETWSGSFGAFRAGAGSRNTSASGASASNSLPHSSTAHALPRSVGPSTSSQSMSPASLVSQTGLAPGASTSSASPPSASPASAAEAPTAYVVTHAGVIRVLASLTLGISVQELQEWPLDLAAIVWLRRAHTDKGWHLVRWNA